MRGSYLLRKTKHWVKTGKNLRNFLKEIGIELVCDCGLVRRVNERRVVSIPASCSGGPGFKSGLGHQLSSLRFSWFSWFHRGDSRYLSTLKLDHYRFLPNPFQFIIIQLSHYHRRYILYLQKEASWNKVPTHSPHEEWKLNQMRFWFNLGITSIWQTARVGVMTVQMCVPLAEVAALGCHWSLAHEHAAVPVITGVGLSLHTTCIY
jgi:hypothetical protein